MSSKFLFSVIFLALFALFVIIGIDTYLISNQTAVILSAAMIFALTMHLNGGNIFSPALLLVIPWTLILLTFSIDISKYSRPISQDTINLLLASTAAGSLACSFFYRHPFPVTKFTITSVFKNNKSLEIYYLFGVLFLASANVAYSGYIPLLSAIFSGDSGYLEFGIPSALGFLYSLMNSASIIFFVKYKISRDKLALACSIVGILIQVLFYSRQNALFLMLELFFVKCLIDGFPSFIKTTVIGFIALTVFAAAGDFRSGDIRGLIGLNSEYENLPSSFVWLYAYSYFNVLNLDNLVYYFSPVFDGRSLAAILPSFLRSKPSGNDVILELSNFNVSSYLSGLYLDVGLVGACIFIIIVGLSSSFVFYRFRSSIDGKCNLTILCLTPVFMVSCLFSFFHNFFLFPPVFFQFFFIPLFASLATIRSTNEQTTSI